MTPEEKQAMLDAVKAQNKEQIDSFTEEYKSLAEKAAEGKISKEDADKAIEALETKINESSKEVIDGLAKSLETVQEELKEAQLSIKKFEDEGLNKEKQSVKGIGDLLKASMEAQGLIEEYVVDPTTGRKSKMMKGYDSQSTKHTLKAAIDMTTALSLTPGADPGVSIGYLTDYKMKDVQINLSKDVHAVQFMPTDPISDKYMGVLVEYSYEDGAGTKAEGSASSKSSIKFKTIEYKVFTIATHFRVSKENLADLDRLVSKLNRIEPDRVLSSFDSKVFSATGDNSTDVEGMYVAGNYTAFVATTFTSTVDSANLTDLIRKMKLQAHNADEDVNVVVLHPTLIDEIEDLKNADKDYLSARGIVYDMDGRLVRIHGLTVISNKNQTTTKVTVMWNEAAEIGVREDVTFEIGLDGNDLTEGMRTIVFEMRAAFGVGKPGGIIVSTDPTADIAILDSGV